MPYITRFDAFRAYCVIAVFAFHANLSSLGWIGVQAFFVLSGFLITRILCDARERNTHLSSYLSTFYMRRALRIFPAYYAFLLLLLLVVASYSAIPERSAFLASFPYLLTYTENLHALSRDYVNSGLFSHLWSLSVEEQFYIIWPVCIWFMPMRYLARFCIAVALFSLTFRSIVLYTDVSDHFRYVAVPRLTMTHLDAFAIGALAGIKRLPPLLLRPYTLLFSLALVLAGGITIYLSTRGGPMGRSITGLGWHVTFAGAGSLIWGYAILNLFFAHLLSVVAAPENSQSGLFFKAFDFAPAQALGRISYGFYIYHDPVLSLLLDRFPNTGIGYWLGFTISMLVTIVLAMVSFRLIEMPFLRLKRFWSQEGPGKPAPMPAGDGSPSSQDAPPINAT